MEFFEYELSKYRNKESTNEWTSICDIGKMYKNNKLTIDKYLEVEDGYIKAIKIIMKKFSITSLIVMDLEQNFHSYKEQVINDYKSLFNNEFIKIIDNLKEGYVLEGGCLDNVLRANLREVICCTFYSNKLHFIIRPELDFYIRIICPKLDNEIISEISKLSLYIGEWENEESENL